MTGVIMVNRELEHPEGIEGSAWRIRTAEVYCSDHIGHGAGRRKATDDYLDQWVVTAGAVRWARDGDRQEAIQEIAPDQQAKEAKKYLWQGLNFAANFCVAAAERFLPFQRDKATGKFTPELMIKILGFFLSFILKTIILILSKKEFINDNN